METTIKKDEEQPSSFKTRVVLEIIGKYHWIVAEPFEYYRTNNPDEVIHIPVGTVTDIATVPRVLWSIFPPFGAYSKAAIVHDYLYENAINDKKYADEVFLEAMTVAGVPRVRRWLMYQAVRLFGRGKYDYSKSKDYSK